MTSIKRRLSRLIVFYYGVLGGATLCKVAVAGLAISLMELVGLTLVFPFLKLVTDTDLQQRVYAHVAASGLGTVLHTPQSLVFVVGIGVMLVYVFRGWFSSRLVRFQSNIGALINSVSSDNLISNSLAARYQLFLDHSPVKIAGVSHSNATHASLLFQSMTSGFNETVLLVLVLIGIFIATPVAFICFAISVITLGLVFFRPLTRIAAGLGRRTQEVDLARHRFVYAMASAVRDIKIMGLEVSFSSRNRHLVEKHTQLSAEYNTLNAIQRMAVEIVLVCGVIAAAMWFSWTHADLNQSAPMIVTLGLIAVRSAPALSRIAGAYNGFRYSLSHVEGLLDMRMIVDTYPQKRQQQRADFPGEYRAEGLSFSYGARQVLIDCTISIDQGEVIAVVGPSGAGKSTLLDLLAGLQEPSAGSFSLGGIAFSPFLSATFPNRVGYVPQVIALLDDTIAANIALEENINQERLQRAITQANLTQLVDSLPLGLETPLGDGGIGISGGQRQRLGIARAFYREPALLILDEVTSALDEDTARAVIGELLSTRGQTSLLFVAHDLRFISADRTYFLDQGRLQQVNVIERELPI